MYKINLGRQKKKRKAKKNVVENQKLNYFYTPYRKELLADNRKFMTFVSAEEEKVCRVT